LRLVFNVFEIAFRIFIGITKKVKIKKKNEKEKRKKKEKNKK